MRTIKPFNQGLSIAINHAAITNSGLTQIDVSIPLDAAKYLSGVNLIDCIKPQLLPNIPSKVAAMTQQFTSEEIDQLAVFLSTGIVPAIGVVLPVESAYSLGWIDWLTLRDNAMLGVASLTEGSGRVDYT
jgi:hypothetical protein